MFDLLAKRLARPAISLRFAPAIDEPLRGHGSLRFASEVASRFAAGAVLRLVIAGGSGVALYFPLDRVYSPSPAEKSARALLPPALSAPRDDIW